MMAETEEAMAKVMADLMSDISIKNHVHRILGPDGQGLVTWRDVNEVRGKVRSQGMNSTTNRISDLARCSNETC